MNEVQVMTTQYSRGGPSTRQPTHHEQRDLKFVLSASHGEFPRIVLCSGDLEECFYDAIRIFNYAEQFQMPSIHLIDKSMANTSVTIPQLKADLVKISRGKMVENNGSTNGNSEPYHRFAFSPDGVSPRAVLGSGHRFWNSGDEHDEMGHIEEDPFNRISMMDNKKKIVKYDGRPMTQDEIYESVKRIISNPTQNKRVVLTHGA